MELRSIDYDLHWEQAANKIDRDTTERIEHTVAALPLDVHSVLDIGCGDGRLTHAIAGTGRQVVAADISATALSHVKVPSILASADNLGVADKSFDLVLSSEMLEHLPEPTFREAIAEISRVAKKYILVTVPNAENLVEQQARCRCGTTFHTWGHERQFTAKSLRRMFPGFELSNACDFGKIVSPYNRVLLLIKQRVAGQWAWEQNTHCPRCQNTVEPIPLHPTVAKCCDFTHYRILSSLHKRRAWLLSLFKRY
jgi:SAM-dependent methyltransferase